MIKPTLKHYPYKAELASWAREGEEIWWPVSSNEPDNMVIGDRIPGDKETARLCARCCNIAYEHALDDVQQMFAQAGIEVSHLLKGLTRE